MSSSVTTFSHNGRVGYREKDWEITLDRPPIAEREGYRYEICGTTPLTTKIATTVAAATRYQPKS